jgi:hypothetical protein
MTNFIIYGRKQELPALWYILLFAWKKWGKPQHSVRITGPSNLEFHLKPSDHENLNRNSGILPPSSALKMETAGVSETLASTNQSTWRFNPKRTSSELSPP